MVIQTTDTLIKAHKRDNEYELMVKNVLNNLLAKMLC